MITQGPGWVNSGVEIRSEVPLIPGSELSILNFTATICQGKCHWWDVPQDIYRAQKTKSKLMTEILFVLLRWRLISVLNKIFCLIKTNWTLQVNENVSLLRLFLQAKDLGPNEYLCGSSYGQAKVELTMCVWSNREFEALVIFNQEVYFLQLCW